MMEEEKNVEIVDVFVAAEGAAAGSSTTRLELAAKPNTRIWRQGCDGPGGSRAWWRWGSAQGVAFPAERSSI